MTTAREIIAMSVDAMIKHHQAVAEVITHAMSDYASAATGTSWNKACFAFEADAILCALSRAGFRVLGPDDLDEKTVERCVEVANAEVAKHQGPFTSQPAYVASCAIRDAIRAMKSGGEK